MRVVGSLFCCGVCYQPMQVKVRSHHSLQISKRIDSESSQSCQLPRDIASYSEIIANLIHVIELVLKPLFFYCSIYLLVRPCLSSAEL